MKHTVVGMCVIWYFNTSDPQINWAKKFSLLFHILHTELSLALVLKERQKTAVSMLSFQNKSMLTWITLLYCKTTLYWNYLKFPVRISTKLCWPIRGELLKCSRKMLQKETFIVWWESKVIKTDILKFLFWLNSDQLFWMINISRKNIISLYKIKHFDNFLILQVSASHKFI